MPFGMRDGLHSELDSEKTDHPRRVAWGVVGVGGHAGPEYCPKGARGRGGGCPLLTHAVSVIGVLASDWSLTDFGAYQRGMCNLSARWLQLSITWPWPKKVGVVFEIDRAKSYWCFVLWEVTDALQGGLTEKGTIIWISIFFVWLIQLELLRDPGYHTPWQKVITLGSVTEWL